jgi:hypothetical protein
MWCTAVDLDLNVGDVGNSVDRQSRKIPSAKACHGKYTDHHQPSLTNGKRKNAVNHRTTPDVCL